MTEGPAFIGSTTEAPEVPESGGRDWRVHQAWFWCFLLSATVAVVLLGHALETDSAFANLQSQLAQEKKHSEQLLAENTELRSRHTHDVEAMLGAADLLQGCFDALPSGATIRLPRSLGPLPKPSDLVGDPQ